MNHVSLLVSQNLKLNMPGIEDQFLQVDLAVAEAGLGLAAGGIEQGGEVLRPINPAHTTAAPAGGGLDKHRVTDGLCQSGGLFRIADRSVRARNHRYAAFLHQGPCGGLVPHPPDYRA